MISSLLKKRLFAGSVALVFCLIDCRSWASSAFEEGVRLYGQKNYRAAAAEFEKVIASSSSNVNAIYYCALSQQLSNNHARAQQLFEYIVTNYANSSVAPLAQQALSQLRRTNHSGNSQRQIDSKASTENLLPAETQADTSIKKARADCDAIMKKAEQQIEDEKAASQTMYVYSDGHTETDISDDRKHEILNEAQERCRKVMDTAERTARVKALALQNTVYRRTSTATVSPGDGSDLIAIIRNQGEHPPVSRMMTEQVKSALSSFPPQFVELLRANRAKVQVTPTMIDLYPNLKNTRPRGYEEGHTYKNCPALFDRPNIVVAEYALSGDDDSAWEKLEDPVGSMRHEMGHALDAFLGRLTETEEFKHTYYLDLGKLDQQTKERLSYYTQKGDNGPSEAFAEVFAGLYGKRSLKERQAKTDEVVNAFPGLATLIKKKITEFRPTRKS